MREKRDREKEGNGDRERQRGKKEMVAGGCWIFFFHKDIQPNRANHSLYSTPINSSDKEISSVTRRLRVQILNTLLVKMYFSGHQLNNGRNAHQTFARDTSLR